MSQIRKVVVMDSNGKIWTEEQPTPEPESGQLLVEVRASMVSPGSGLGGVKKQTRKPRTESNQASLWLYQCWCRHRQKRGLR